MAQLLFDAISATHRLKAAGFVAKQAEAVVQTVTQANSLTLQLVQDLADLKAHVTQNMVTKTFLTETLSQYDLKNMVVKDDIKNMVVKDDLKGFATKDDLKHFATKDDIRNMVVKDDIKNFATKDDLRVLESKLNMKIYLMAGTVVAALKALEYLGI
ncbi:MAG: hypothetical protein OXF03_02355 [Gammaproteobacteria bacterium]|nr:hypothetical protein [Gammaproteobacteria bacterium]